jgi:fructosamine-3-kinase
MTAPPAALAAAAGTALGARVSGGRAVAGGDLNDGWRLDLDDGRTVFVKTAADAPAGGFASEAAGLRWLAAAEAIAVPEVLAVVDEPPAGVGGWPGKTGARSAWYPPPAPPTPPAAGVAGVRLLALEWVEPGRLDGGGEERLGRELAALHGAGAPRFGAFGDDPAEPLRIGPIELPNGPAASWAELYADQRLRPLARRAAELGALPDGTEALVDRVCDRLPELAGPPEPPARLHGDLWSGNVLADATGRPWLIDPAAHGGQREVDLAMLRLFGGPGERCFAAYAEAAPLADGHAERVALWQLFPLLVHAALFGGHYGASVARVARRYG